MDNCLEKKDCIAIFDKHESNVRSYCRDFPAVFNKALGSIITDTEGRDYIDFLAGAGALNYGHNNPYLKEALLGYVMSDGICHGLDFHSTAKRYFIEIFNNTILLPRNLNYKIQFTGPTGTNAVEAALKLARKITGRTNIIAFTNAYHGMSLGSLAATTNPSKRAGSGTFLSGITFMPYEGYFGTGIDSFGFRLKDVSPFSDRVYFPEFVDYFYKLNEKGKETISRQLRTTNYSSADGDVLNALYMANYEDELSGNNYFKFIYNTEVLAVEADCMSAKLELNEVNVEEKTSVELDAVILATGFLDLSAGPLGERHPPLLTPFVDKIETDEAHVIQVTKDYRVKFTDNLMPPMFLNGLCEASHGFGDAGSFSLLSIRSEVIGKCLLHSYSMVQQSTEGPTEKLSA